MLWAVKFRNGSNAVAGCVSNSASRSADWLTHSGDPQRSGWQQDETKISKDSVKNLKLLWGGVALGGLGAVLMITGTHTYAELSSGAIGVFYHRKF